MGNHKREEEYASGEMEKDSQAHKSKCRLGIRNFKDFNHAFLAKNAWSLIRQSDSLVNQVLNVSYFPSSHFLETNEGVGYSQLYKGSLYDKEMIEKCS